MAQNEEVWVNKAVLVLRALLFNVEHPSPMRNPLGGAEIDAIRALLREYDESKE